MQDFSLRDKRRRHLPPAPRAVIAPSVGRWLIGAAVVAVLVVLACQGAQAAPVALG